MLPRPHSLSRTPLPPFLLLFRHVHQSSNTLIPHSSELWISKVLSISFALSPSSLSLFSPLNLSPLVAFSAIQRIQNPISALKLFNLTREKLGINHTKETFRLVITSLCYSGLILDAVKLFDEMINDGYMADKYFLGFFVDSCLQWDFVDSAMVLLAKASDFGFSVGPYSVNKVLTNLARRNRLIDAINFFKQQMDLKVFIPDVWSFNIALKSLFRLGDIDGATDLFNKMKKFGCSPDIITYNIIIDGLCRANQADTGLKILRAVQNSGICSPNSVTYNTVISAYCKMGRIELARMVYDEMLDFGIEPCRITYNVLIDGYGKSHDMDCASKVFDEMRPRGFPPDVITFTSLIDGYCRNGQLNEATRLWKEMGQKGIKPNIYTFAIMIHSLCKMNRLEQSLNLLMELNNRKDIVPRAFVYNPVIDGLCKAGKLDIANLVLTEMERNSCSPDKYTYTILMIGLCMKGRTGEAIGLFRKMINLRCLPDKFTVSCLVSCLLKAGLPSEANRIMLMSEGNSLNCDTVRSENVNLSQRNNSDISVAI